MGETLVIGYGSALRGDDAAGLRVAALVARWRLPGVRVLAPHQLYARTGRRPRRGCPRRLRGCRPCRRGAHCHPSPLVPGTSPGGPSPLGHAVTPNESLALCRALYERAPESLAPPGSGGRLRLRPSRSPPAPGRVRQLRAHDPEAPAGRPPPRPGRNVIPKRDPKPPRRQGRQESYGSEPTLSRGRHRRRMCGSSFGPGHRSLAALAAPGGVLAVTTGFGSG